jgi:NADH:ubiquinone oxidoreductase subunit 6 (subunit J)
MLFGIMFTQKPQVRSFQTIINRQFWAGLAVALGVGGFLSYVLVVQNWGSTEPGNGPREISELGETLLGVSGPQVFSLLFEVVSVLLLVAIIAAIVISRRKPTGEYDAGTEE